MIAPGGERLGKIGGKAQMREQADERPVIEDDGDGLQPHGAVPRHPAISDPAHVPLEALWEGRYALGIGG